MGFVNREIDNHRSKLVDIVIVNWNGGEHLERCIESLCNLGVSDTCNLILVDNNSSDHSLCRIEKFINKITLHVQEKNVGFAKGCNIGASYGSSKYILFLNPDLVVNKNTVSDTLDYYRRYETSRNLGVVGIRLYDVNGRVSISCSKFPRWYHFLAQAIGLHKLSRSFSPLMALEGMDEPVQVDQITGAFYFISRSIFQKFSGFDERFFVYYEELDLSLRLSNSGFVSYALPMVNAMHYGGGCSETDSLVSLFYNLRSRLIYFRKNYSLIEYCTVYFITIYIEIFARYLKAVVNRSDREGILKISKKLKLELKLDAR